MFVLVHSNFDHNNYYYYYDRVLSARPHVEASLRDGLIKTNKKVSFWSSGYFNINIFLKSVW